MSLVSYDKKPPVAHIMLNRSNHNPINRQMTQELMDIWIDFQKDESLLTAVLGSNGQNFSVGFDIKEMVSILMSGEKYAWGSSSMFGHTRMGPDGAGVRKPIVGAFSGHVNGAGFWLFLQTDIRLSTPEATYGTGEARINFPIEFTPLLPRFLPRAVFSEMIYTCEPVSAQRLYELGVINHIVESETLLEKAASIAQSIALSGPLAVETMKELVDYGYDTNYRSLMELTGRMLEPVVNAQDTQEALTAFMEKRPPVWKRC